MVWDEQRQVHNLICWYELDHIIHITVDAFHRRLQKNSWEYAPKSVDQCVVELNLEHLTFLEHR